MPYKEYYNRYIEYRTVSVNISMIRNKNGNN